MLEGDSPSALVEEVALRYVLGEIGIEKFLELIGGSMAKCPCLQITKLKPLAGFAPAKSKQ